MARAIDVANEALKTANEALNTIKGHERVCEERHKAIATALHDTNVQRDARHAENKSSLQRIYGLLWKAAIGVIFLLIGFVWQLLTRGQLP